MRNQYLMRAAAIAALVLVASQPALAGGGSWTTTDTPFGTTVSNGDISFRAPDAKAGEQMAKALNKAEKKADRMEGNQGGGSTSGGGEPSGEEPSGEQRD